MPARRARKSARCFAGKDSTPPGCHSGASSAGKVFWQVVSRPTEITTLTAQLEAAEQESQCHKKRICRAEAIIAMQTKITDALGIRSQSDDER